MADISGSTISSSIFTPKAEKVLPAQEAKNRAVQKFDTLEEVVRTLAMSIDPVLAPSVPSASGADSADPRPPRSAVTDAFDTLAERASDLASYVLRITDRVEV